MLRAYILMIFLLGFQQVWTQHIECGYDLAVAVRNKQHPGYLTSVNKTFQDAKSNINNLRSSNTTYEIPVVVHVVWNEEEEQIPDSLINSQIDVLNEDFQRLNEDADQLRDIFTEVAGNPMIQFRLEEVIYVQTENIYEVNLFSQELIDEVKETAEGGSDPRNNLEYLNIWICKIQPFIFAGETAGQILGYAYPPNDLDNWPDEFLAPDQIYDGVVLDFRVVGKNNPFTVDLGTGEEVQFSKGRIAVHEVGHYLGLRHTWGDGEYGAINSCNFDDGIDDTPNAGVQAMQDCNFEQNTCSSTIDDLPDMIENYMDLSKETCQNTFTIGQVNLMRSVLENQRCQLVENIPNCTVSTHSLEKVSLNIQPNPSTGLFEIYTNELDLNNFKVELIDLSGRTHLLDIKSNELDLSAMPNGIYFIRGQNEHQIFQQKIIKL